LEYIVYCDESSERCPIFSYFYGGALLSKQLSDKATAELREFKKDNNCGEMKWTKVSLPYLERYKGFIDLFFDYVEQDLIKVRIMFQQNEFSDPYANQFSQKQHDQRYFLLYYQFLKHAFGFDAWDRDTRTPAYLRVYFDRRADKEEKVRRFKRFIHRLQYQTQFRKPNLRMRHDDIVAVRSHDHEVLQCVDIILGSMQFRLNRLHLVKPPGSRVRGKRTRAKESLYRHMYSRISRIIPRFNIGTSTGLRGSYENRWRHPYRHWLFIPNPRG